MIEKTVRVVSINESQGLRDDIREQVGELYTCYVFDPERTVHCCEIRPSYEMVPFDFYTKNDISDELHGTLMGDIMGDDGCVYMHCHSVDAMDARYKADTKIDIDEDDLNDEGDNIADLAAEQLKANVVQPPHALEL